MLPIYGVIGGTNLSGYGPVAPAVMPSSVYSLQPSYGVALQSYARQRIAAAIRQAIQSLSQIKVGRLAEGIKGYNGNAIKNAQQLLAVLGQDAGLGPAARNAANTLEKILQKYPKLNKLSEAFKREFKPRPFHNPHWDISFTVQYNKLKKEFESLISKAINQLTNILYQLYSDASVSAGNGLYFQQAINAQLFTVMYNAL